MEVLWKMARSQSVLFHSPGMILGKIMKRGGERIHVVKVNPYSTVIYQGQHVLEEKNRNSKNQSLSNNGLNEWRPCPW